MNRIVTITIFLVAMVVLLKMPTNYSIVMIERLQDQQEYQHGNTDGTRHSDGSTNRNESAAMATTSKSHIPTFVSLPQNVVDEVKSFVFFLGHARSGHSIVGSLLDAHPHIVLGHEVDVFTQLSEKLIAPNRFDILNVQRTKSGLVALKDIDFLWMVNMEAHIQNTLKLWGTRLLVLPPNC